jgi:hypothetical protein
MAAPPAYAEEQELPFGQVVLPPDQALTGYASHAAQKSAPAPRKPAVGAQAQPKAESEKKNGPSAAAIPAPLADSKKEDEDGEQA